MRRSDVWERWLRTAARGLAAWACLGCRTIAVADAAPGAPAASGSARAPAAAPAPSSVAAAEPQQSAPVPAPAQRRAYRVAAMGDSLTDPRSHGGLYLRYLQERCPGSRFDSYGRGGEMVNQMRRRFAADVLAPDPTRPPYTHVIVFGGVNDLYSDLTAHRTVPRIENDLTAMYAMARAQGLRVVALTVTPWGGFRRYFTPARAATTLELNRWILAQVEAKTVDHAVDAYPLLSCGHAEELCERYATPFRDGLHFGPEGHRRIAEALFKAVFADCQ